MAHRTTLEAAGPAKSPKQAKKSPAPAQSRDAVFDAFRCWGYLESTLDPLGLFQPLQYPDLQGLTGDAGEEARACYCGTIGAEFMHLPEPERRRWISERMEAGALTPQQARKLKLAATQSMIARLETLSAAYDGKIASVASARDRCTPESGVSSDATTQGMRSRLTVDIRELKSTATRTARQ